MKISFAIDEFVRLIFTGDPHSAPIFTQFVVSHRLSVKYIKFDDQQFIMQRTEKLS